MSSEREKQQAEFLVVLAATRNLEFTCELQHIPALTLERWMEEDLFRKLVEASLATKEDTETARKVTAQVVGLADLAYRGAAGMLLDPNLSPSDRTKLTRLIWEIGGVGERELIVSPDRNFQVLGTYLMGSGHFPGYESEAAPPLSEEMQTEVDKLRGLLESPPAIEIPTPETLLAPLPPPIREVGHMPIENWRSLGMYLRELKKGSMLVLQKLCEQLVYLYEHREREDSFTLRLTQAELARHQGCSEASIHTSFKALQRLGMLARTGRPREWHLAHVEWLKFIAQDYEIARMVTAKKLDVSTFQQAFYTRFAHAREQVIDEGAQETLRQD